MSIDGVSVVFRWFADAGACGKCQQLNGREYRDQDVFADYLYDYAFGPIWDLNTDMSLAHPNCRCWLDVEIEVDVGTLQIG